MSHVPEYPINIGDLRNLVVSAGFADCHPTDVHDHCRKIQREFAGLPKDVYPGVSDAAGPADRYSLLQRDMGWSQNDGRPANLKRHLWHRDGPHGRGSS
jgi:hypothetical protein